MFRHIVLTNRRDKLCQYNLWYLSLFVGGRVVFRSEVHFRPEHDTHLETAHDTATDTEWQSPQVVLTQFVSPDDEHDVLETM